MIQIIGNDKIERKNSLANLVVSHLNDLGHEAVIVKNRKNSKEHTDRLVVNSNLGLVHVTALSSLDPNEKLPYQKNDQRWLADKSYVAIGWNTKDHRTLVFFIAATDMLGKFDLTKSELNLLKIKELSKVFV